MTSPTSPRILIIEDEPLIAFGLEHLLVKAGFRVSGIATKLSKALALIELDACDAAIVDANLAGVSASPAGAALADRGLPFVVLSGYSPEQQSGAFPGAAQFLQKPCRPDWIIAALRKIVPDK